MASSSSSSLPESATASSQSCISQVFLSFRGEDTRKTFVDHLYEALQDRKVITYKDDEKLPRGESICPALFSAIKASQIAVVIFSKNYADSSWCLDELAYIMKCKDKRGLIVMPIFYDVVPSEVRKQEGHFERGFAKLDMKNSNKVVSWRKALVDASNISGWEVMNTANGHEAKVIKEIADAILKNLCSVSPGVDKNLVGMSGRLQQLEKQLGIGSGGVRMVGVWGLGGIGKTTLASSLYMKVKDSYHFQGQCFIENVREKSSKQEGLQSLQENLLSTLLKTNIKLQSVVEGKHMISTRLNHSKVLIVLDDVDNLTQLETLVGSHDWFGSGSRIIITTRDEHLLRTHKIDLVCPVTLLSDEEAVILFNKHAHNKFNPVNDYETLSSRVVSNAARLPLALKVLGSFLYDKNEKEWISSLSKLKDIPEMETVKILKISYDGLETLHKELFLDIACFLRGEKIKPDYQYYQYSESPDDPMEVFEACGYHPDNGLKVLEQKALITIVYDRFEMHDLVQEMGLYIVRGEHSNSPEKCSRVWKYEDIMRLEGTTKENNKIEAIQYVKFLPEPCLSSLYFCKIVSNMKKLRYLSVSLSYNSDKNLKGPDFLSNGLRYIRWNNYPRSLFPDNFQPMKLVALKLYGSLQKQLWIDDKHLPHLKVLVLKHMKNLLSTPNFEGFPSLQKLTIEWCWELQEIHTSLGKHTSLEDVRVSWCKKLRMFPTIVHMGNLKSLRITNCHNCLEFPLITSNMKSLVELDLIKMGIDALLPSIGDQCPNLISIHLTDCSYSKNTKVNFHGLKNLKAFIFSEPNPSKMTMPRKLFGKAVFGRDWYRSRCTYYRLWLLVCRQLTHSLRKLDLSKCGLKDGEIPCDIGELSNLQELDLSDNNFTRLDFSLSQLTRLKLLNVSVCRSLVELPKLPSGLVVLRAVGCDSLTNLGYFYTDCKWLFKVSLVGGGVITDGSNLLQSMIEEYTLQNHSMVLAVRGLEIAKEFRLELPENWFNDFSGFLLCAVGGFGVLHWSRLITMQEVLSGMDSEDYVVEWEESNHDTATVVLYVPFASLRNTSWWNSAHKELFFTLKPNYVNGLGVKLVARKSGNDQLETLTQEEETEICVYAPKVTIQGDSPGYLSVDFPHIYEPSANW